MNNEILAVIAIALALTLAAGTVVIATVVDGHHIAFAKKTKDGKISVLRVKPVEG